MQSDPAGAPNSLDAYKPREIAALIEDAGVGKAHLPWPQMFMLAALAGTFIALGGAFYLATISGFETLTGGVRFMGGIAFSLGLVLVVVAGAELFTGNALMVMALVDGRIGIGLLLRNWGLVFVGNACGAFMILVLMIAAGLHEGAIGDMARRTAEAKLALTEVQAVARGILCNALVCLAVWLSVGARSAAGKALVVILPIAAFVTLGFEHSIANLFLIPMGLAAGADGSALGVAGNLVPVTLGNIIGGAGGVALSYWVAYGPDRPGRTDIT